MYISVFWAIQLIGLLESILNWIKVSIGFLFYSERDHHNGLFFFDESDHHAIVVRGLFFSVTKVNWSSYHHGLFFCDENCQHSILDNYSSVMKVITKPSWIILLWWKWSLNLNHHDLFFCDESDDHIVLSVPLFGESDHHHRSDICAEKDYPHGIFFFARYVHHHRLSFCNGSGYHLRLWY